MDEDMLRIVGTIESS